MLLFRFLNTRLHATYPTTPALVCHPSQPATPSAFDVTYWHSRGVQDLVEPCRGFDHLCNEQAHPSNHPVELLLMPIELASIRQVRKCPAQMPEGVAIKISFALELRELSEQR
jgi:hypothetical protein